MLHASIRRHLRHGMLPQLAVFEAAARLGSFTRAAQSLHLAQPTVSTQLRKLSETLELALFEQIGKKVHLTPAGQALYEGCSELFATFARIEDTLCGLRDLDVGRLRIAISSTAEHFVPGLLAQFAEQYPKVEVSLQIQNRQGLIDRLAANADDLYLFIHPPTDHELVCQPVREVAFAVYARHDHPLAGRRDIALQTLADEPMLLREVGAGTRQVTLDAFARHGLEPRVRMELASDEAIEQAIVAGLGVAVLARGSLRGGSTPRALTTLDVRGFPIKGRWQFVYPVGKQVSPAARAFMELVRTACAPSGIRGGPEPGVRQ